MTADPEEDCTGDCEWCIWQPICEGYFYLDFPLDDAEVEKLLMD